MINRLFEYKAINLLRMFYQIVNLFQLSNGKVVCGYNTSVEKVLCAIEEPEVFLYTSP